MPRTRRSSAALLATLLSIGLLAAPTSAAPAAPAAPAAEASAALYGGQVQLQHLASGLVEPLGIVNAADGTNRLFVLERRGTVRVIVNRQLQDGFFLDLRTVSGGINAAANTERGLLGLAFHPQFETNRKVFAFFTDGGGDIQIGEFTGSDDGTSVGANTYDSIFTIEHSANSNHNGGQLMFGPDGALYAFVGDGGGSNDPNGNAQNDGVFLGKMLRLVPDLNGTASGGAWAKGLRNPWRASFDRANGDLWIGDVGQGSWEEINKVSGNPSGVNYGWDRCEGAHAFEGTAGECAGYTGPALEYSSAGGGPGVNCSVTGGYVYRGPSYLDFAGQYVLGDFCTGNIWTTDAASPTSLLPHGSAGFNITSFGEDERGELYVTDYSNGAIYKVVAPTFNDVLSSPYIDDITWLHYAGITDGCGGGSFCPIPSVSRAEMAAFILRAIGHHQHLPAYQGYFADVPSDAWYAGYVEHLYEHGITLGCGGGNYCPASPVTRDEMASFLARALALPASGTNWFDDDDGNIHEGNINAVADAGITLGCGGRNYCPGSATTREQMAAFIRRALTD